jgi:thiamine-monophosphate kinase
LSGEFNLIYQHIAPLAGSRGDVVLGIGDDGAVIQPQLGTQVVVALDTLVAGRHFFVGQDAADIAYKALAVNLSDLAAMGATPKWALLSLALPVSCATKQWLEQFMRGWSELAQQYDVVLIGGDTTYSDTLTVSVTLMGEVVTGQAITRSGARVGDDIWLSGCIGDAGFALSQLLAAREVEANLARRLHRPTARVALGLSLTGLATAAIDVSDGLLADLGHILKASNVGAVLNLENILFSEAVSQWVDISGWENPLTSGDDYELLFSANHQNSAAIRALAQQQGVPLRRIGVVLQVEQGVKVIKNGSEQPIPTRRGFDHFASTDIIKTS